LGEATADGELTLCSAKPSFEVGAVGFESEHGASLVGCRSEVKMRIVVSRICERWDTWLECC
jgi:hypothetical protein